MKGLIGIILAAILAAGCMDEPSPVETKKLFLPRDSERSAADSIVYTDSVLTLLLVSPEEIVYYTGKPAVPPGFKTADYKGIRDVLTAYKKRLGAGLVVVIKPFPQVTYKNTVDILNEMAFNEIMQYKLVDLTPEDLQLLGESIKVPTPEEMMGAPDGPEKAGIRRKHITLILNKDNSLSYSIDDLIHPVQEEKIQPPTKERIKEIVSAYKESLGTQGNRMNIVIRGDKDAGYSSYRRIIEALKELELYKFSMETVPE